MHGDFEYTEFQAGLIAFVWGLWIVLPWSPHPQLHNTLEIATEPYTVGSVLLALGSMQMWAVVADKYKWRQFAASFAIGAWAFVAILLGQIYPAGISFPTSVCLLLNSVWGLLRLAQLFPEEKSGDAAGVHSGT